MATTRFHRALLLLAVLVSELDASRLTVNQELSNLFNEFWTLDVNRMQPGVDYSILVQGKAGYVSQGSNVARDRASQPLFSNVNETKLGLIPTFSRFLALLDNYEMSTGVAERVSPEEVREINLFLDAIMETEVMKVNNMSSPVRETEAVDLKQLCAYEELECVLGLCLRIEKDPRAQRYLVGKSMSSANARQFRSQLYLIWFQLYHRERNVGMDSSGFEHVFVGETKSGTEIIGFHNWLQFYLQEKHGHLDYKGYKAREQDIPDQDDHVLNLQFSWHGLVKPVGSAFVGASPEFEMALFTVVFLMNTQRSTTVLVNIDQCQMELVVIRHGRSLGTAYPRLLSSNSRHLPRSPAQ